jgi:hypothetical protein
VSGRFQADQCTALAGVWVQSASIPGRRGGKVGGVPSGE